MTRKKISQKDWHALNKKLGLPGKTKIFNGKVYDFHQWVPNKTAAKDNKKRLIDRHFVRVEACHYGYWIWKRRRKRRKSR